MGLAGVKIRVVFCRIRTQGQFSTPESKSDSTENYPRQAAVGLKIHVMGSALTGEHDGVFYILIRRPLEIS